MSRHNGSSDPFSNRLSRALDIHAHSEITPDPSTLNDLKSRLRKRRGLSHQLGLNAFLPTPVGSFGAIAAAAVILLCATIGRQSYTSGPSQPEVAMVQVDSSSLDSALYRGSTSDSLLLRVGGRIDSFSTRAARGDVAGR